MVWPNQPKIMRIFKKKKKKWARKFSDYRQRYNYYNAHWMKPYVCYNFREWEGAHFTNNDACRCHISSRRAERLLFRLVFSLIKPPGGADRCLPGRCVPNEMCLLVGFLMRVALLSFFFWSMTVYEGNLMLNKRWEHMRRSGRSQVISEVCWCSPFESHNKEKVEVKAKSFSQSLPVKGM